VQILGQRGSPFMAYPGKLHGWPSDLLSAAHYQIVPGPHGTPIAQVDLRFRRDLPTVMNRDLALVLLIDNSGSMTNTFSEGHVFTAADTILQQLGPGGGFHLAFYNSTPSYYGWVDSYTALQDAISRNPPTGGTTVSGAIRGVIQRYQGGKSGIYIIIITDGEFSDKTQVQSLVLQELAPKVTPATPYAVHLHFIGAGEEVDREFLEQLEGEAARQGTPLVRQHHHEHLRHAHTSMLDELAKACIGVAANALIECPAGVVGRIGNTTLQQWTDGSSGRFFLARDAVLGFEYLSPHPKDLELKITLPQPSQATSEFLLRVPLPAATQAGAGATAPQGARFGFFHLPHFGRSAEERAAQQAQQEQARQAQDEAWRRQNEDVRALEIGGLPSRATSRLQALSARGDGAFTSDLDADELALLRSRSYRAVGLVTGSAMYHVGQAYASATNDCEVDVLTSAYNEATRLAVARMEKEVQLVGAHGAIGVRYDIVRHEWASDKTIEVRIVGTAVVGSGSAPKKPWLSDLSGREWWALERAGYEPVGLVYGHCTWFVLTTPYDEQILRKSFANEEFRHMSDGLASARRVALQHLTDQAHALGAQGVTGVSIERRLDEVHLMRGAGQPESTVYEYEHHNLILSILGTGIRRRADAPRYVVATRPTLSLRGGRLTPASGHAADATFE
jgi:uncharacterized protein YbjQ (UPF0145 family)